MYCRYCGATLPPDSLYCSKCGKRLYKGVPTRLDETVRKLGLRTPYPYAGLLAVMFLLFLVYAGASHVDYTELQLGLELVDEAYLEPGEFRQNLRLVVENLGDEPVREIAVGFRARVAPGRAIDVTSEFSGRELEIVRAGEEIPLVLVLSDVVRPSGSKRYSIRGVVRSSTPTEVVYEVLSKDSGEVLTSLATHVPPGPRSDF